jgi:hypothetical protein
MDDIFLYPLSRSYFLPNTNVQGQIVSEKPPRSNYLKISFTDDLDLKVEQQLVLFASGHLYDVSPL